MKSRVVGKCGVEAIKPCPLEHRGLVSAEQPGCCPTHTVASLCFSGLFPWLWQHLLYSVTDRLVYTKDEAQPFPISHLNSGLTIHQSLGVFSEM